MFRTCELFSFLGWEGFVGQWGRTPTQVKWILKNKNKKFKKSKKLSTSGQFPLGCGLWPAVVTAVPVWNIQESSTVNRKTQTQQQHKCDFLKLKKKETLKVYIL